MAAQLKRNAGPAYVRILAGFANQIAYDLYLEDAPDQFVTIARRQNQNPSTYLLSPDPRALNGDNVLWGVDVVSPSPGENQAYSVTIEIMQGGRIVPGGRIVDQGQFNGVTVVTGTIGITVS